MDATRAACDRFLVADTIAARWLWVMRWYAVGGQLLAVLLGMHLFQLRLPSAQLFFLIGIAGVSNLLIWRRLFPLLLLDVALLTALLFLSGGTDNPFVVIYIVHVALASFVLVPKHAAVVALASFAGYALLFVGAPRVDIPYTLFLRGLAVAVAVSSALVFVFIAQLAMALRKRQYELHSAEQLATLGSFAAEAAHELGTPLGTIAITANDMPGDDAELIREEVERCQRILQRMHHRAGQMHGEVAETLPASESMRNVLAELRGDDGSRVQLIVEQDAALTCPQIGLRAALMNVVSNALQASDGPVTVRVSADAARCRFSVEDHGRGMEAGQIARIGQPFFSTKPDGMGLGLFLTSTFVSRVSGKLNVLSQVGTGTVVTLELPR